MTSQRPRFFLFVLAIILLTLLFKSSASSTSPYQFIMGAPSSSGPIANLDVQIKQGDTSPPTFIATVTNNNDKVVTFLDYDSPVDAIIMALGNVDLTPHGASEPVTLSTIAVRRLWPPKHEFLVELAPGASISKETEFKTRSVPMDKLGSKFTAHLKGEWMSVWEKPKSEITEEMMDAPSSSDGFFTGQYSSNTAEFNTQA